MFIICSYTTTFAAAREVLICWDCGQRRLVFDIVYHAAPNRHPDAARTPSPPRNRPVNFLYMGLFLRFKKT